MQFLFCLKNEGYETSLELKKIYSTLEDTTAEEMDLVRVVDEFGEDYLYPKDFFVSVALPKPAEDSFLARA